MLPGRGVRQGFDDTLTQVPVNPKTEVGEHTRLGCRWTRLASSRLAQDILPSVWNFSVPSGFSARARKTARAARALPISISEFGVNQLPNMSLVSECPCHRASA